MTATASRSRVDVCVVSYRRPQGLLRLLSALAEQDLSEPAPQLRVVVVDNDPAGSARAACAEAEAWLPFPLLYAVEKQRGIPQARNAALALARERSDFVAFVDDDEEPARDWLAELLRVQAETGAAAVTGPCEAVFEEPPPAWLERGRLFEPMQRPTGERVESAATNNLLVSSPALFAMEPLFDERMALSGGSDHELFGRFTRRGHTIVWADAARVREWVPPSRATLGWVLRRQIRVGTCTALVDRRLLDPPLPAARLLGQGLWCVAKGTLLAVAALRRGPGPAVAELRLAAYGAGRLAGLCGWVFEEYRSVHGR